MYDGLGHFIDTLIQDVKNILEPTEIHHVTCEDRRVVYRVENLPDMDVYTATVDIPKIKEHTSIKMKIDIYNIDELAELIYSNRKPMELLNIRLKFIQELCRTLENAVAIMGLNLHPIKDKLVFYANIFY